MNREILVQIKVKVRGDTVVLNSNLYKRMFESFVFNGIGI
jgi:hypothetical protein